MHVCDNMPTQSTSQVHWYTRRPEKGVRFIGAGVRHGYKFLGMISGN